MKPLDSGDPNQGEETKTLHFANTELVVNQSPMPLAVLASLPSPLGVDLSLGRRTGSSTAGLVSRSPLGIIWFYISFFLLNARGVAAKVDFETLISESRRLSMSGFLGLIETDVLFAESGTSQPEYWRVAQGTLGIGSLRVLSKVCKMPCFEQLHQMHGIKPPESVEAREFWLRQEAWTEIQALDMGQEDTSYHRINQGSGPQGKLLFNWEEIETERKRWGDRREDASDVPTSEGHQDFTIPPKEGWAGVNTLLSVAGQQGEEISQGTTDKWWMDRWQIEALAVASQQGLTLEEACNLLTTAYFGTPNGHLQQLLAGILCMLLTVATFLAAWYTNWSWIPQFFALSSLGYFVNWTASLRGWKFVATPKPLVQNFRPRILKSWPTMHDVADGGGALRIAVQSSGTVHLRGLVILPKPVLHSAKEVAASRRGRYKITRKLNKQETPPYSNTERVDSRWISFESESSFYGLLVSVEPDNAIRRSVGVIWVMVDGVLLLMLGFGASIPDNWSKYILPIYILGVIIAISGRCRERVWTLPEFKKVDLTLKPVVVPPTMKPRIVAMGLPKPFEIAEENCERSSFSPPNDANGGIELV